MDIIQEFYNNLSSHYDKLFANWDESVKEQADIIDNILSQAEITEAKRRAENFGLNIHFEREDFRDLSKSFNKKFDIIIAMDNALPHMLTIDDLEKAIKSITSQIADGGMLVASIRDYDEILRTKPTYSPPYIHKTSYGQRVSFQAWKWEGINYRLTQYIIEDGDTLEVHKFECEYRATKRDELTQLLLSNGCKEVSWKFPCDSGYYQPILIAKK